MADLTLRQVRKAYGSIEILHGKKPFVVLDADTAGQFTIWSGPGTSMTAGDGTVSTPIHPGDIADWEAGAVQIPCPLLGSMIPTAGRAWWSTRLTNEAVRPDSASARGAATRRRRRARRRRRRRV